MHIAVHPVYGAPRPRVTPLPRLVRTRHGFGQAPALAPGSVPLNPYIPGASLNEALIAAGYSPTQAAQIEASDLAIPGYGSQPGQYQTITNPALDVNLPGYGANVGGQLFNVQSTIVPAPNQNILATAAPVSAPVSYPTPAAANPTPAIMYQPPTPAPAPAIHAGQPGIAPQPAVSAIGPSWFTDPAQSMIPNVPNWALLAGAAAGLVLFTGRR